jgi:hypothetical protein
MTSAPVVSVNDELLAEIESQAQSKHSDGFKLVHNIECLTVLTLTTELRRLRAENEALRVDAVRYRWLRDACDNDPGNIGIEYADTLGVDAAIDTAMQSNTEGN